FAAIGISSVPSTRSVSIGAAVQQFTDQLLGPAAPCLGDLARPRCDQGNARLPPSETLGGKPETVGMRDSSKSSLKSAAETPNASRFPSRNQSPESLRKR